MRPASSIAVAVAVVAAALALTAGTARAGGQPVECNGSFTGTTPGNLIVPSGDFCIILDSTIGGNVLVEPGAIGFHSHRSTIAGSVLSPGPIQFDVRVLNSTVGHDVVIGQTAAGTSGGICRSTIGNNVILENDAGYINVGTGFPYDICQDVVGGGGNHIEGNLVLDDSSGVFPITDNTVDGGVHVDSNTGFEGIFRNVIAQTLECSDNVPSPFSFGNTAGNYVGQCAL